MTCRLIVELQGQPTLVLPFQTFDIAAEASRRLQLGSNRLQILHDATGAVTNMSAMFEREEQRKLEAADAALGRHIEVMPEEEVLRQYRQHLQNLEKWNHQSRIFGSRYAENPPRIDYRIELRRKKILARAEEQQLWTEAMEEYCFGPKNSPVMENCETPAQPHASSNWWHRLPYHDQTLFAFLAWAGLMALGTLVVYAFG